MSFLSKVFPGSDMAGTKLPHRWAASQEWPSCSPDAVGPASCPDRLGRTLRSHPVRQLAGAKKGTLKAGAGSLLEVSLWNSSASRSGSRSTTGQRPSQRRDLRSTRSQIPRRRARSAGARWCLSPVARRSGGQPARRPGR